MVEDVYRIILGVAKENGISRIDRVNVVIGEYLQVKPALFEFAFEAAGSGTLADGADLNIEIEPVEIVCRDCRHRFLLIDVKYECPRCGGKRLDILKGKDLYIKSIEGE